MNLKLVDNWRNWWKWLSMHAMIGATAIQGAWMQVPEDMKQHVPAYLVSGATIALLVLGIVGRLIKQPEKEKDD